MPWPVSYDIRPSELRQVLEAIQAKANEYSKEAFWSSAVFPGRIGEVIRQVRSSVKNGVASGDAKIGYLSQLNDVRAALRRLDTLKMRAGRQVDPRLAAEAFGDLFTAASAFMGYAAPPFNAYAEPMRQWGMAFGSVAQMLSGTGKVTRSMDATSAGTLRFYNNAAAKPNSELR